MKKLIILLLTLLLTALFVYGCCSNCSSTSCSIKKHSETTSVEGD